MKRLRVIALLIALAFLLFGCASKSTSTSTPQTDTQASETPVKATPTPLPEPTPTPIPAAPEEWFDGRIGITIDNVVQSETFPTDIELTSGREAPIAGEGQTFVCIYLTVTHIEGVHLIDILGHQGERPILIDAGGGQHDVKIGQFSGVKFSDLTNLTGSAEYVEGAKGVLVFVVTLDSEPASLKIIYSFKKTLEEDSPTRGEMTIEF